MTVRDTHHPSCIDPRHLVHDVLAAMQAIRVLLRLGVDVTSKGSPQSPFPGLTAYQARKTW